MNVLDIRDLARRYDADEIEDCIKSEVFKGSHGCSVGDSHPAVLDDLAKAEAVRDLMEAGMSLQEAFREVARRIRTLGKGGGA